MKEQSTLDGFLPNPNRRSGNTTRLVDRAIQIIFNGDTCLVEDHYKNGEDKRLNKYLFYKILDRLDSEHSLESLSYDVKELTIKLK